jgi:hypothetical protein
MKQIIDIVVWFYSSISTILFLWTLYLFTLREWLDRRIVMKNKSYYDYNGICRIDKLKRLHHEQKR